MRRGTFIGLTLFALSHLAFANVSSALAQAGSTGGTIGKQNKSISGGSDQPQTEQKPKVRERNSVRRDTSAAPSIDGTWAWTAKCDDGSTWSGKFDFAHNSDGIVSGSAEGNDGSGSISGRIIGNKFTASRSYWNHSNNINFTFEAGGKILQGSESSQTHGTCRYQANRS
jgi:hypothetical protein